MAERVKGIPEGFGTLTPHVVVRDAAQAIAFYSKAFNAEPRRIHYGPDGKSIMHAELVIGDSILMLTDEFPEMGVLSPASLGGSSVTIHMYIEDVDEAFDRAVSAGGKEIMPVADQFWGDRYGQLVDPFGHKWSLATQIKEIPSDQIEKAGQFALTEMSRQIWKEHPGQ